MAKKSNKPKKPSKIKSTRKKKADLISQPINKQLIKEQKQIIHNPEKVFEKLMIMRMEDGSHIVSRVLFNKSGLVDIDSDSLNLIDPLEITMMPGMPQMREKDDDFDLDDEGPEMIMGNPRLGLAPYIPFTSARVYPIPKEKVVCMAIANPMMACMYYDALESHVQKICEMENYLEVLEEERKIVELAQSRVKYIQTGQEEPPKLCGPNGPIEIKSKNDDPEPDANLN